MSREKCYLNSTGRSDYLLMFLSEVTVSNFCKQLLAEILNLYASKQSFLRHRARAVQMFCNTTTVLRADGT